MERAPTKFSPMQRISRGARDMRQRIALARDP